MNKPAFLGALLLGVLVMTLKIVFLFRKNDPPRDSNP